MPLSFGLTLNRDSFWTPFKRVFLHYTPFILEIAMEVDSKNTVSVKEIEEKVEESKEEKKEEEAPNFPALSAQEMAVRFC